MATDLNLHRKTAVASEDSEDGRARDNEVHNRERTWLMCFCLDRSHSAQMGKPHSIKEEYVQFYPYVPREHDLTSALASLSAILRNGTAILPLCHQMRRWLLMLYVHNQYVSNCNIYS